jgi:hypothetical protein
VALWATGLNGYRDSVHLWRISKYDPRHRDQHGAYQRDEWTASSDIGKAFVDGVLTEREYLRVEGPYVSAVRRLWNEAGEPPLQIQGLETYGAPGPLGDVGFGDWRPANGELVPSGAPFRPFRSPCGGRRAY